MIPTVDAIGVLLSAVVGVNERKSVGGENSTSLAKVVVGERI